MAKPSSDHLPDSLSNILSPTATISSDVSPENVAGVLGFLSDLGVSAILLDHCTTKDFYYDLISGVLKPLRIEPGRVTCLLTVRPAVLVSFSSWFCVFPSCMMLFGCLENSQNIFISSGDIKYTSCPKSVIYWVMFLIEVIFSLNSGLFVD